MQAGVSECAWGVQYEAASGAGAHGRCAFVASTHCAASDFDAEEGGATVMSRGCALKRGWLQPTARRGIYLTVPSRSDDLQPWEQRRARVRTEPGPDTPATTITVPASMRAKAAKPQLVQFGETEDDDEQEDSYSRRSRAHSRRGGGVTKSQLIPSRWKTGTQGNSPQESVTVQGSGAPCADDNTCLVENRPSAVFFLISRGMPTANAEGPCRSEGT